MSRRGHPVARQDDGAYLHVIPQMCVLVVTEEGRGGSVLLGMPNQEELLRRTCRLPEEQRLHRRGVCDRAGW